MISDLDGSLGSRHVLNVANERTCFPSWARAFETSGLITCLECISDYKPTDSHSYLFYSSSHPLHVDNHIPYSQFLRLRRLCSEDSDFSLKSEKMCEFCRQTCVAILLLLFKRTIIAPN